MWRGRIVSIYGKGSEVRPMIKSFEVGLDDDAAAVAAVRNHHPELNDCDMEAIQRLSTTAVAFLELQHGEVRTRLATPGAGDGSEPSARLRDTSKDGVAAPSWLAPARS